MAKDPAFLFYPNDYIGGTMGMTFEEKGAYMELLMMQFNRGHMTTHMIGQTVGQLWDKIQVKFTQDSEGLWYNERLEEEQIKRKKFTESRRKNVYGNNKYSNKSKKQSGHMTSHMENENINENKDISINNVYRKFNHLSLTIEEKDRLINDGYNLHQIDSILDDIENYKNNTKYTSLNLTARKWLKREYGEKKEGWDITKEDQSDFSDYETNQ